MEASALPCSFGPYVLLDQLGRGGMGDVFLASRMGLGDVHQLSVIKTLRTQHATDLEYISRFTDEAKTVVQLSHRNIAKVFDIGIVDDVYYMAMELVLGADLTALMDLADNGARLAPAEAVYAIVETLEALDFAHRFRHPITGEPLNIVHRDVSPHNVMLSYEGEVKLIDFGLSASRMKKTETAPQVVMGKLLYMAPEQARDDPVDGRADLYPVGIMLVELLSGRRYYKGMSAHAVWSKVGVGFRSPAVDLLPPSICRIAERAIAPEPADRYPDADTFRAELLQAARSEGWHAGPPEMRRTLKALLKDQEEAFRVRIREAVGRGSTAPPPERAEPTQMVTLASVLSAEPSTLSTTGGHAVIDASEPSTHQTALRTLADLDTMQDVAPLAPNDPTEQGVFAEVGASPADTTADSEAVSDSSSASSPAASKAAASQPKVSRQEASRPARSDFPSTDRGSGSPASAGPSSSTPDPHPVGKSDTADRGKSAPSSANSSPDESPPPTRPVPEETLAVQRVVPSAAPRSSSTTWLGIGIAVVLLLSTTAIGRAFWSGGTAPLPAARPEGRVGSIDDGEGDDGESVKGVGGSNKASTTAAEGRVKSQDELESEAAGAKSDNGTNASTPTSDAPKQPPDPDDLGVGTPGGSESNATPASTAMPSENGDPATPGPNGSPSKATGPDRKSATERPTTPTRPRADKGSKRRRGASTNRKTGRKTGRGPPPDAKPEPKAKPLVAAGAKPKPPSSEAPVPNVKYLRKHCGGEKCAKAILKRPWTTIKTADLPAFGKEAAACARLCSQR